VGWVLEHDYTVVVEKYYTNVRKRRYRRGKPSIPKHLIVGVLDRWLELNAEFPNIHPSKLGVYANMEPSDAKGIAPDLLMVYNKGRFYPNRKFLNYFKIEKTNEVTMVKSLQQELSEMRSEMKDTKTQIAKLQLVVGKVVEKMINNGDFEEVGLFPPADESKVTEGTILYLDGKKELNV